MFFRYTVHIYIYTIIPSALRRRAAIPCQFSNKAKCTKCKLSVDAGDWRIELGSASAFVASQGGRAITDIKHTACFFDWLGGSRRLSTKGLRMLDDLAGCAAVPLHFKGKVANPFTRRRKAISFHFEKENSHPLRPSNPICSGGLGRVYIYCL